jgi:hypothetical protein
MANKRVRGEVQRGPSLLSQDFVSVFVAGSKDAAFEAQIAGAIYFAHPAGSQRVLDFVGAKSCARD